MLRTVCAWCRRLIHDGEEPTSHGICAACRATHFPSRLGTLGTLVARHIELLLQRKNDKSREAGK